jgi:hypothetical protein
MWLLKTRLTTTGQVSSKTASQNIPAYLDREYDHEHEDDHDMIRHRKHIRSFVKKKDFITSFHLNG